jgi:acetyl-CoA acetyltransferase
MTYQHFSHWHRFHKTFWIFQVEISSGRGKPPLIVDKDESLAKFNSAKLRKLGPTFKKNGSVTAGNSSSIRFTYLITIL